MKKLVMFLITLTLLAFSGFAYAESLTLGGKTINYNMPDGYVKAEGADYSMLLNIMQQAMPPEISIKAIYVTNADDEAFRSSNGDFTLNNYLIITALDQLASHNLSAKEFKEFKRELKENYGLVDDATAIAKERLNDVFSGVVQLGNIQTLGCFGETDTELSYVLIMDQQTNIGGKKLDFRQALVLTGVFTNERLLFINQYRLVESEAEVGAFKDYALDVLKQMNFPGSQSVAVTSVAKKSAEKSGMSRIAFIIIVMVVVMIVIIIVAFIKNKNRGGNKSDIHPNDHTRK